MSDNKVTDRDDNNIGRGIELQSPPSSAFHNTTNTAEVKINTTTGETMDDRDGDTDETHKVQHDHRLNPGVMNRVAEIFMQFKSSGEDGPAANNVIKVRDKDIDMAKFERVRKADYGLNVRELRQWQAEKMQASLAQEDARQEEAIKRVRRHMTSMGKKWIHA